MVLEIVRLLQMVISGLVVVVDLVDLILLQWVQVV